MNPFLRKILVATGLTRQGDLVEATAVIQRALADASQASTHDETSMAGSPGPVVAEAATVIETDEHPAATPLV